MAKLAEQTLNDLIDTLLARTTATTKNIVGLIDDRDQKADALFNLLATALGQTSAQLSLNCVAEAGEPFSVELGSILAIKKMMQLLKIDNKALFEDFDKLVAASKKKR